MEGRLRLTPLQDLCDCLYKSRVEVSITSIFGPYTKVSKAKWLLLRRAGKYPSSSQESGDRSDMSQWCEVIVGTTLSHTGPALPGAGALLVPSDDDHLHYLYLTTQLETQQGGNIVIVISDRHHTLPWYRLDQTNITWWSCSSSLSHLTSDLHVVGGGLHI